MNGLEDKQGLMVKERPINEVVIEPFIKSDGAMVSVKDLPIAKQISNEQRIEEEKFLRTKEAEVAHRYQGIRGYLRLFEVSRVIATLSLYLYLDQFDIHRAAQERHRKERLKRA